MTTAATIFEALRQSHDLQRDWCEQLLQTQGASEERKTLFKQLRIELDAHASAEERHFYLPLIESDQGLSISRHAIGDHRKIEKCVETLQQTDMSSPGWLAAARKLVDEVLDHLQEEEHGIFQQAGKILSDQQKTDLIEPYLRQLQELRSEPASA